MAPWMHGVVGNPSGSHRAARVARRAVEDARDQIAALTGAKPGNVVFTAGGTESCTLAVAGFARAYARRHGAAVIVHSAIEHHAVSDAAAMVAAEDDRVRVRTLGVDDEGVVDLADVSEALGESNVAVLSVMAANNETGVLQPLDAIASAARAADVVSHADVVAAAPWMDLRTLGAEIDMLSLCAHKIGGPVNAGALILRRDLVLEALTPGGGQEKGRRGGTVDVAAAVGLAEALRLVGVEREVGVAHARALRERLEAGLTAIEGCRVTAYSAARLPGTVHVTFPDVASDELLFLLDQAGVYASAAASCSSGAAVASHVLAAMGLPAERAKGSLRLSFGTETSTEGVEAVIAAVTAAVERLRAESR